MPTTVGLVSDTHGLLRPGVTAVVFGHSHQPHCAPRVGVLFVNPGSIGPRRFTLPVAMAKRTVDGSRVDVESITLG